ncbi:hypothetical protein F4604DRAFT_1676341 [Suillus subluteus]|nr:hypothetical protein F4604DRAFT_1676341 [Suillus subluteus]
MDTSTSAKKRSMSAASTDIDSEACYQERKNSIKRPKVEDNEEPHAGEHEVPIEEAIALGHLKFSYCKKAKKEKLRQFEMGLGQGRLTIIEASLQRLVAERWDAEEKHCEEAKRAQLLELLLAAHVKMNPKKIQITYQPLPTMPHNCGYCDKPFSSSGSVKKHIATHPECQRKWESMVRDTDDEDSTPTYNNSFSPLRRSRSVDFEEDNPIASKSRRVTVEDVTDEEDGRRYFEPYPEAGWTLQEGQTSFERHQQYKEGEGEDKWAPFGNEEEWGLAEWLVKSLGQTKTDEFLKLPITLNRTKPSFHNNRSFLQRVDALPHGPAWNCKKVSVKGNRTDENGQSLHEDLELWTRDPVECIKELIRNPLFKEYMVYAPSRAYKDKAGTERIIDDMWTADWWWDKQKELPEGATIAPIILASDKTMLSQFRGDKSAWPVYLSIGNIAKEKRRQTSAQRNHPHRCLVAADERGDPLDSLMRDPELTKEILERRRSGQHPVEFDEYGLRPVYKPFWANLPHTDIFLAFTPDLLHQLHKGVFKDHLVKWCLDIAIPDYPGLRHFKKGISSIKQWTGTEHKEMQRIFMALITGAVPSRVAIVTRALLDFCYYARLHTHTSESLDALENALAIFHAHKDVLQELASIKLFGAADGFNTELPERLHIDFAKEAYRASNKRDYEEQMVLWLQRQEAIFCRTTYLEWVAERAACQTERESEYDSDSDAENEGFDVVPVASVSQDIIHVLAKTAPHPRRSVQHLETMHGAVDFLPALKLFLQKHLPHNHNIVPGPQDRFDTFRQVVIILPPDPRVSELPKCLRVRATPEVLPSSSGRKPGSPNRFDMALVSSDGVQASKALLTLNGPCVVQAASSIWRILATPCDYSEVIADIGYYSEYNYSQRLP